MLWIWWLLILAAMVVVSLLAIYDYFAPRNIFFTMVTEGTAKIVVKAGAFDKVLMQWKGYALDENGNIVPEGMFGIKEPRHLLGGIRWIGLWPAKKIYIHRLRWTSVRADGTESYHDEDLDQVLLKEHLYLVKITEAEDKDMVPLSIFLFVTMKVVNPRKAIFNVQDYMEMVQGRIQPLFRQYAAGTTFRELTEKRQGIQDELWKKLEENKLIESFEKDYGILIKTGGIEIKDINPPKEYQEAATKRYKAERERERIIVEADAEAQRVKAIAEADAKKIGILAEAEAARIQKINKAVQKSGDLGKLVRTLEAAEKSPLAASLTVQSIPGLSETLKEIFGKSSEGEKRKTKSRKQKNP